MTLSVHERFPSTALSKILNNTELYCSSLNETVSKRATHVLLSPNYIRVRKMLYILTVFFSHSLYANGEEST